MTVVTRFAPSPTGNLHIGSARTALFNLLYARRHGGRALLRIEDTDRERSTPEAVAAIFEGLAWLGLAFDEAPVLQSSRLDRHVEIARQLLENGRAYRCYCSPEELREMRETARAEGRPMGYDGRWRDRDPAEAPEGVPPVIRIKAPRTGETRIHDHVQGAVTVENRQLDDFVLLRADGTPTYMLSVVVDDHDMAVTHVVRGDDHLNNSFRQSLLYAALDWPQPDFAHIPLIHGADGAKLSKRHGAVDIRSFQDLGILPEAMLNALLRLGWSHGDDEIISRAQAETWFDLDGVGRSAARFDMAKLENLNAHYLRQTDDGPLVAALDGLRQRRDGRPPLTESERPLLVRAMPGLKQRARTLVELLDGSAFYITPPPYTLAPKAAKLMTDDARAHLEALRPQLSALTSWQAGPIEETVRAFIAEAEISLKKVAQPMRVALTGTTVSPGLFEVMEILGPDACLARIDAAVSGATAGAP